MKAQKHSHLIAILSAGALWGFMVFPLRALNFYSAQQILNGRIVIAFFIVWVIIFLCKKEVLINNYSSILSLNKLLRSKILLLILISGVLITINWLTFIYVINNINLKAGAYAYLLCPLIAAFAGNILLKEPLSKLKYTALTLAFICIIGLASGSFVENVCSVFIALTYALFLMIQKIITQVDRLVMLGLQLFIALIILLIYYFFYPHNIPYAMFFWGYVSVISLFFTILPLLLSLYALEVLPSTTIGIAIYTNPLISFSIATLYYNEQITLQQFIFYALLFFAVVLFNYDILEAIFLNNKNKPKLQ